MIAKSLRCQGWAPCIIATIWLPEPLLEESLAGVEDELRERCARHPRFARLAVFSLRSAVTRRLLLSGKLVPRRITRFESRVHIVPGWNFGEAQLYRCLYSVVLDTLNSRARAAMLAFPAVTRSRSSATRSLL